MPMIDFKEIKRIFTLRKVLEVLRYRPRRTGSHRAYGPCLLCKSGNPLACKFRYQGNCWFCHSCKRGGNALELFAFVQNMPVYEAAIFLCREAGIEVPRIN